ncbi:MAG TPA: DegV family protein [Actinomycetota bacterium]|nr:DegV family protein [Actinomycetota bacterium]
MVAVVTDSASNIPVDLAAELGITVVPLHVRIGETVYRDGVDPSPADFYRRLAESGEDASTSASSPGDFVDAFDRSGQTDMVCVTVAEGMSSNHQHARLAAEQFPGRVEVVDSKSASMGEGFVALEAARISAGGASVEEVVQRAIDVARKVTFVATVDTFEYLKRSGRVTKLQAYAATMLDIKPVFAFRDGNAIPVARGRTRRRALQRIVDEALKEIGNRRAHVAVVHAAAEEDARDVLAKVQAGTDVTESIVTEVTPVVGVHVGPGLVGTAFFCDEEEK